MDLYSCITMFLWIVMSTTAAGLRCWKCIAHDCETDPSENVKAAKVDCKEGQSCMKVRYRMFDNYTHYDSIVRTCPSGHCLSSTMNQFQTCVKEPKKYMISGCVLKSCCQDRDLCNSTTGLSKSFYSRIILLFVTSITRFYTYTHSYTCITS